MKYLSLLIFVSTLLYSVSFWLCFWYNMTWFDLTWLDLTLNSATKDDDYKKIFGDKTKVSKKKEKKIEEDEIFEVGDSGVDISPGSWVDWIPLVQSYYYTTYYILNTSCISYKVPGA